MDLDNPLLPFKNYLARRTRRIIEKVDRRLATEEAYWAMPDGGDITIKPGRGRSCERRKKLGKPGRIIFLDVDDNEKLSLQPDGSFRVNGKSVAVDIEVYRAFRQWLADARVTREVDGSRTGKGGAVHIHGGSK